MRHRRLPAVALILLAGCAGTAPRPPLERPAVPPAAALPEARSARMALPDSVAGVAEESFGRAVWGRRGEFRLTGAPVRYLRSAERWSLFDALPAAPALLSYEWDAPGAAAAAACTGRAAAVPAEAMPAPWTMNCRWRDGAGATLQIGPGGRRDGQASREGAYRRGDLTIGLRSVHRVEDDPQPRATAVGYELLHEGVVVGSVELGRGLPKLRRPDPATPLGRAVTEAALALALASEPR